MKRLAPLLAPLLVGCTVAGSAAPARPVAPTRTPVPARAAAAGSFDGTGGATGANACPGGLLCGATDVIVDAAWVARNLDDPRLQLVDTRSAEDFAAGHLPGALHLDASVLRTEVDGVPGQVAPLEALEQRLGAAGLRADAAIVVYGAGIDTGSARVVWTLEYLGHGQTALLDGGFVGWTAAARTTSRDAADVGHPGRFRSPGPIGANRVDAEWVLASLERNQTALIDTRSDQEYAAGHIPGALHVDWVSQVSDDGPFLGAEQLSALYPNRSGAESYTVYCRSGSRASVTYVVLRSLGVAKVRLYDGSWAEWGARSDLPTEP